MSDHARDLLVRGIAAAKAKDKEQARFYLEWVLMSDADTQQKIKAWLWLSEVSDDPKEKRDCLENILVHQPTHPEARRGLAILDGRLDPSQVIDPNRQPSKLKRLQEPRPAESRRFVCQQCGGKMAFTPDRQSLTCAYCDRKLTLFEAIEEGAMVEEQDFAVALATARGHSHPIATQALKCKGCGASFIAGPDVLSLTCPYCASAHVVKLSETHKLIPPEGIIPFAITQKEASDTFERWLKEKGLRAEAQASPPEGLYLPVWTFDIGGEVQWRGTTVESADYGGFSPATVTGSRPIFFDDVLVPASHTLPASLMKEIERFKLEGLTAYSPEYLADWPAEVYQISVSDASLVARRKAWEKATQRGGSMFSIHAQPMQDLSFSSAGMAIESYKLILLPFWIARYRYQGKDFSVVVNGQRGAIRAERPRGGLRGWLANLLSPVL